MDVTFWGVRGSYPVPGPTTVRYGGQTSCVEVRLKNGAHLILDAGTGLRPLGRKLGDEQGARPRTYHIVLSHVHWDHIQGLPFFVPAYTKGSHICVYAMRAAADELHQVISGITRHEFFPVRLDATPAEFEYHEVNAGQPFRIDDFEVIPFALNHPFGAVGYRINGDDTSIAYVSDTAPFDQVLHKQHFLSAPETLSDADRKELATMRERISTAITGTDTVIYDTHFSPEEYEAFPHYGHSTPDHALDLCAGIDIRRVVLYHHAPNHTDQMIDKMVIDYEKKGKALGIRVVAAREGLTLGIGDADDRGAAR